ncbi:MAG: hypothetical protein M1834_008465 [Cirrosporium novae-zelandiae]|nr:MAG: hypothetical protein M1834_008465 [Cirrosporium novae-zelandiae]
MPLWAFNHGPNAFSLEEKENLAKTITKLYTTFGLPRFFVQVTFTEFPPTSLFIGGEGRSTFTAITIHHVARSFQSDEQKKRFLDHVDSILNPVFESKGMDWEYYVSESPRDLWKTNGIYPPEMGPEMDKWVELDRPLKREV